MPLTLDTPFFALQTFDIGGLYEKHGFGIYRKFGVEKSTGLHNIYYVNKLDL